MVQIQVNKLTKTFRVPEREAGLRAAFTGLFRRRYKTVRAVEAISLSIQEGEIVGFLGPNGAGKTTTLKMLTGLLHPDCGEASVLGFVPWRREAAFLRQISLLMGQRSQLNWDLPAADSFDVQLAIYGVDRVEGRATLKQLVDLLEIGDLLKKQVRTLSLGERMKCELCMSLLFCPRVLFLDEPTIGVDITMQSRIRQFIADYNRRRGATVILTSHYMADVTALCRRIIVINLGRILFDGPLAELSARLSPYKVIAIDLERDVDGYAFEQTGAIVSREPRKVTLSVAKDAAPAAAARLLADLPILDLTIQDPPIEDTIERAFRSAPEARA
ncbi:Daunorubicin/doxorubicin resistance ATP-binding protein DrrA [Phycisphaerae bacterium RAS1]|nr:Daunorubicin/doxorubicin resistance ATP-binding protein DrrA [Phycisphaerae bacterium RAS1]